MSGKQEVFFADQESGKDKLSRKAKDSPFMIGGMGALVGIVGYAAYMFKNKKQKTSVYLIHTRVAAQGAIISALTLGVAYHMVNKWIIHGGKDDDEE